jgi:hypothetical protein
MQNAACEISRIYLPGTWANKSSKRKGRGQLGAPGPLTHLALELSLCV